MFSGGQRAQAPSFRVVDEHLVQRPYNAALNLLSEQVCGEVGQAGSDRCLFETRTAFDCLLRHKVQKNGELTDNLGACKFHITNMKEALGSQYSGLLDAHLERLNYSRQSFVWKQPKYP